MLVHHVQIAPNPKSCFPFAEVTAAVAAHHPGFVAILIGKLHEVSAHWNVDSFFCLLSERTQGMETLKSNRAAADALTGKPHEVSADENMTSFFGMLSDCVQ